MTGNDLAHAFDGMIKVIIFLSVVSGAVLVAFVWGLLALIHHISIHWK